MRLGINDEGMIRIASQLRIGQDIQIDQGEGQGTEYQGEVTVTRVVEDQENESSPVLFYFSNGLVWVGLPSGQASIFDTTTPSGAIADSTKWDQANQAMTNASGSWSYQNNEPPNGTDEEWISRAQEMASESAGSFQDAQQDYYGTPGVKM